MINKRSAGKFDLWTDEQIEQAEKMRCEGMSYSEIGLAFGIGASSISAMFRRREKPIITFAAHGTRWRIKQLLTAGYTPSHIAEWIDVPLPLAMTVFDEWMNEGEGR